MSVMFSWLHLLAGVQAQQQKHNAALKVWACKSSPEIWSERKKDVFSMLLSYPRSTMKTNSQRQLAEQE